jgi:carbamoyltransferase
VPAITHIDYSARIQSVNKKTNPRYWSLINEFKKLTGYGVIVNTSFNVRGEPIVCTPDDAFRCFMRTEMDFLVIGNYLFDKTNQTELKEGFDWKEEFLLD